MRELRNRIQRAALLAGGAAIRPEDLGLPADPARRVVGDLPVGVAADPPADAPEERRRIEALLVDCGGVVSQAAERLGLSRQALYRRMERLGIVLERRPRP